MPIPPSRSGIPRRSSAGARHSAAGRTGTPTSPKRRCTVFGVAAFDVGLPAPLAIVSAHLDPFVADRARAEANLIATRALRYGSYGIVAGDINHPPVDSASPSPDYAAMLPYNTSARTRLPSEVGGQLVPDRRVTEILAYTGFVDATSKLFEERGNKALLRRTATDDRIDTRRRTGNGHAYLGGQDARGELFVPSLRAAIHASPPNTCHHTPNSHPRSRPSGPPTSVAPPEAAPPAAPPIEPSPGPPTPTSPPGPAVPDTTPPAEPKPRHTHPCRRGRLHRHDRPSAPPHDTSELVALRPPPLNRRW
ncbi:hypothetical protein [Streptomyces yanii]|uniref:Endonuclease/exonuclease/phosphatase domain-containing protein n=1 Tax=Streptomyces yanii TaxID=78510 RepID=A0ABV5R260_9ACTN